MDAVFEMRFDSQMPVASIWPGMLYGELPGEKSMENLPLVSLPKEIRDQDPNLVHSPLCRISWGDFWILIGDRVFCVAAKLPYSGWDKFSAAIDTAFGVVLRTNMVTAVNRCSIKYVDILDSIPLDASQCFKFELTLGGRSPTESTFHVRMDSREGALLHMIQVGSAAQYELAGGQLLSGPVLDIDSVYNIGSEDPKVFLSKLSERANELHAANKRVVFDCLSSAALAYLEPTYE
ncbi:TIGR04255 family protein [Pseudomonas sp. GD03842]|uniref:TIGR04255 family protein n=1 Tax=Pseudomonas sp. GD03842 TaxID=2975385 RepID=UPI0024476950|nr:TIGR04255 family protein [Pseudomonas sp. GD03842]MDH0745776.1 TIGR04255 family protein [Pseudomonas sp. GD03842]